MPNSKITYLSNGLQRFEEYSKNGNKRREKYYENGLQHCESGPAVIQYSSDDSHAIEYEEYRQRGKLHRIDGPAVVKYLKNGCKFYEEYCQNGALHRIGEPAVIHYNQNGQINKKEYWENGATHRIGGPAIIDYYDSNEIKLEIYHENSSLHRIDGPAVIYYYKNGDKSSEEYCQNGALHRIGKPAILNYDNEGNVFRKEYWENGVKKINNSLEYYVIWELIDEIIESYTKQYNILDLLVKKEDFLIPIKQVNYKFNNDTFFSRLHTLRKGYPIYKDTLIIYFKHPKIKIDNDINKNYDMKNLKNIQKEINSSNVRLFYNKEMKSIDIIFLKNNDEILKFCFKHAKQKCELKKEYFFDLRN